MKSSWTADPKERRGWLAPSGKFFPCKHGQHQDKAEELWRAGEATGPHVGNSPDILYGRGWRSLHDNAKYLRSDDPTIPLTQPQIDFLGDLADAIRQADGPQSPWAREFDDEIAAEDW